MKTVKYFPKIWKVSKKNLDFQTYDFFWKSRFFENRKIFENRDFFRKSIFFSKIEIFSKLFNFWENISHFFNFLNGFFMHFQNFWCFGKRRCCLLTRVLCLFMKYAAKSPVLFSENILRDFQLSGSHLEYPPGRILIQSRTTRLLQIGFQQESDVLVTCVEIFPTKNYFLDILKGF